VTPRFDLALELAEKFVFTLKQKRPILKVLLRSLRLLCPACGQSSIIEGPFRIRHHCPTCDSLFKREAGFFVGAIMANVITTEFVILASYVVLLLLIGVNFETGLTVLFVVGILFPVAFYHHSWSFWLGFDYLIESLPRAKSVRER
jgi:uncharacterized protein (DUF983 family)